jgi:hypothetical protein
MSSLWSQELCGLKKCTASPWAAKRCVVVGFAAGQSSEAQQVWKMLQAANDTHWRQEAELALEQYRF